MARPKGPPGQTRQRVLDAALDLFAEHGVSGTSLQMIADRLGVTKAAVYHQFHAKADIALALLDPLFGSLITVVEQAEAAAPKARHQVALRGLITAILEQRQVFGALSRDPELERVVSEHAEFQDVVDRLRTTLLGKDPTPEWRIAVSLFTAGVTSCAIDPSLADVDDRVMQGVLEKLARTMLS